MVEPRGKTPLIPALALGLNALVWGLAWIPFRELQSAGVHALWATAMVFSVAVIGITLWRPSAWRGFTEHPMLWVLFLASGLSNVGFNWAVTIGDVVRVALLFYTMPAWAVLLAWLILRERPQGSRVLQLLLALAGVAVVLKKPDMPWPVPESLADYLALMGGFAFALTNVMLRKAGNTPSTARMLAMFGGGAGISLTAAVIGAASGHVPMPPAPAWPWVLWAASLSLGFLGGNLALQYGATRLSAITCSLIMLSEVLFASVSSMLLGAAAADARTWVGGGMILLAALLASRSDAPN